MSSHVRPPVWKMVREAVESLDGEASYREIINYIQNNIAQLMRTLSDARLLLVL